MATSIQTLRAATETLEKFLESAVSGVGEAFVDVSCADAFGCQWDVVADTDAITVEMPYGTDDWDFADKMRQACNHKHLYASIKHTGEGEMSIHVVR